MAKIKVHGGDFVTGNGRYNYGFISLKTQEHPFVGEQIPLNQLSIVEIADEESVKRVGGTLGWSIAGGLVFGVVGLAAGLFLGGRGKDVTFVAQFRDGRRLFATTDGKTFNALRGAAFTNENLISN